MKYKVLKTSLIILAALLLSGCLGQRDAPRQETEAELQTETTEALTETPTRETEKDRAETTPKPETTTAEEVTTEEETVNQRDLYQENFDPYENMRSVLLDQTAFLFSGAQYRDLNDAFEGEIATLSRFLELIETLDRDNTKADINTWKFMCVDLDGDNIKECIVNTDLLFGAVMVFHYRLGHISMYIFFERSATTFYSNGIISSTGGSSSVGFQRMHFDSNGRALLEDVAGTTKMSWLGTEEICAWIPVDGIRTEVTEPEFEAWWYTDKDEFLGEQAPQYDFTPENINMYVTE